MKKILQKGCWLLLFLAMLLGGTTTVSAATTIVQVNNPDRAVQSGSNLFYAIGNDGGGSIICYNIKSGNTKKILTGKCSELSLKGKYIYCTVDKYKGSDGSNDYIYRVKSDGTQAKKLAKGRSPVVCGKYIYYIKTKLVKNGGTKSDEIVGLYRMSLDGSNNKKIKGDMDVYTLYGTTENDSLLCTGIMADHPTLTVDISYEIKTGKAARYYWSFNKQTVTTASLNEYSIVSSHAQKVQYMYSGNSIYDVTNSSSKKVAATYPNGTIKKIIDLDGYFFVVTEDSTKAYVYISKEDGSDCTLLTSFYVAGGGW